MKVHFVVHFSDSHSTCQIPPVIGKVIKVLALPDGEAIITNETRDMVQIVHLDSKGQIKRTLCTFDNTVIKGLTLLDDYLYLIKDCKVLKYDISVGSIKECILRNFIDGDKDFVDFDSCMMISHTELVAANSNQGEIFKWNIDMRRKDVLLSGLQKPCILAYDQENQTFAISVKDHNRIILYDNRLKKLNEELSYSAGTIPPSATFTSNGLLLVADNSKRKIVLFRKECKKVHQITAKDRNITFPVSISLYQQFLWIACHDGETVKRVTLKRT